MDDGDYIVFVEGERNPSISVNIITMMRDVVNLTGQDMSDWRVRYYTSTKDYPLTIDSLKSLIPTTPEEYEKKFGPSEIDSLKTAAGLDVDTKAPKNEYTESLRNLAGIIR
jgi:hypothetical protein